MTNLMMKQIKENMTVQQIMVKSIKETTRKVKYIASKEVNDIMKITDNMREAFIGEDANHKNKQGGSL